MPFWGLVEVSKDVLHVVWWVHNYMPTNFGGWVGAFPFLVLFANILHQVFKIQMNHDGLLSSKSISDLIYIHMI